MSLTGEATASEVPVWEPSTAGRAIDGAPWEGPGADTRWAAVWVWLSAVVLGGMFVWLWVVGAGRPAVVLLGVATLVVVLITVLFTVAVMISGRSDRRMLGSQSWCAATVRVFSLADQDGSRLFQHDTRLLVEGWTERPQWLNWSVATWADQQVLARTGRIWIVGPDARGQVLLCSAGLAVWKDGAEVVADEGPPTSQVVAEQAAPARLPRAGDDVVAKATLADGRRFARWLLYVVLAGMVLALVVLVASMARSDPHKVESLVGAGIMVALLASGVVSAVHLPIRVRRIERLLDAGPWTPVPVALRAGTRLLDRGVTIREHATLPSGRVVPVRLSSSYALTANVAATGMLWVAGEPVPGRVVAAGIPGYPFVTLARIGA